jgi:YVTN family beta-propeller protein
MGRLWLRSGATAMAVLGLAGCGASMDAARTAYVAPASVTFPETVTIELAGHPGNIVAADEGVWAAVGAGTVVRIDPATNRVAATVPIHGYPDELAVGDGSVWVTSGVDAGADVLTRIDPGTNRVVATISLPGSYAGPVAAGGGAVWLVLIDRDSRAGSLVRIDRETNEVGARIPLDAGRARFGFDELAVGHRAVWLLALTGLDGPGKLLRFDPRTNRLVARVSADALNTVVGPGGLWITGCVDCDEHRDTFFAQEIDTDTNAPVGPRIVVPRVASGPIFVGDDSVWFAGYGRDGHTVAFSLDPDSHAVDEFLEVGNFVQTGAAFDAANAAIWIARAAPAAVIRVDLEGGS